MFAKLIGRLKAGGVVRVVGLERDAEEVSIGRDAVQFVGAAHPAHLTVR